MTSAPTAAPRLPAGTRLRLAVGEVAHGGHCVARIGADAGVEGSHAGRVVFVRHALPGEEVTAVVTDDPGGSFCRADAVEVHVAAPGRVDPPCPWSGPGRCGGCDWQHADVATQLELKATVVRDALHRFAGPDLAVTVGPVTVEALPGGPLHWRTRTVFAVDRSTGSARLGLRRHRSHEVEPVGYCPICAPGVGDAPATRFDPAAIRHDVTGVEYVLGDAGTVTTVVHRPAGPDPRRSPRDRRRAARLPDRTAVVDGPQRVWHAVRGRSYAVTAAGFWQVHPLAAATFAGAVVEGLAPQPGERVLDLYAGAGLFTGVLAEVVGPDGAVAGLESDPVAVADAAANLADLPHAAVTRQRVSAASVAAAAATLGRVDLVVLDPPRAGAGADVVAAVCATGARAVAYVACDPVALARDLATAAAHGYQPTSLRAFDAFPMTHHVECVAILARADGERAPRVVG